MEIEKILKIDTTVEDKIVMIFSNNIDIVYHGEPAVSIDKFKQLQMEILAWHKSEVEKLHLPVVSNNEVELKALLERLFENNMCSILGDELIEEALKRL